VRPGTRPPPHTGAVVVGTTRRPGAALAAGVGAVLDATGAVSCHDVLDVPLLGPLLGGCPRWPDRDRLAASRIGVHGWAAATLTAATRLSRAGLVVVEANRRIRRHVDVLITDRRPRAYPSVRIGALTLIGRSDTDDLLLAVAAMLGQPD
jgi:hypothetical protein